jgi:hypothetical protein
MSIGLLISTLKQTILYHKVSYKACSSLENLLFSHNMLVITQELASIVFTSKSINAWELSSKNGNIE